MLSVAIISWWPPKTETVIGGQNYPLELQSVDELVVGTGPEPEIWESRIWALQLLLEASVKLVSSAWKGRLGIQEVRKDRYCHCLSRLARTYGSEPRVGVKQFVRPKKCKCHCNGLRYRQSSGIRPEVQTSDPNRLGHLSL